MIQNMEFLMNAFKEDLSMNLLELDLAGYQPWDQDEYVYEAYSITEHIDELLNHDFGFKLYDFENILENVFYFLDEPKEKINEAAKSIWSKYDITK
jgi:hypothetical protein